MSETSAVICGYARSPFTPAKKGALAKVRPDTLGGLVVKGLVEKVGIDGADIDDIICGCAFPEGEQGLNVGRMITFLAGLPDSVSGQTVNRFCGSSMEAIHIAAGNIAIGKGKLFVCAGVESMTRIPMGGYNPLPHPQLFKDLPAAYISMGITAENVAKKFEVSREAQEAFAIKSHQKAAKADFSAEIIPIPLSPRLYAGVSSKDTQTSLNTGEIPAQGRDDIIVSTDGCIRPDSTPEDLAKLDPAFDVYGTVTAGTSSPLTDGASAVIVASEAYAKEKGLPILARIKTCVVEGLDPAIMGMGPLHAGGKALKQAGLTIDDMDIIEINEAFSAQAVPCCDELSCDMEKVNKHGGAIALGHPLGASGARITGKAAQLLKDEGGKYALATACIGGGMGIATILEAV